MLESQTLAVTMTDEWRDAELGDVVSILKGKKPRTTTNEELGLPYLVAEHLRGGSAKQWVVDTDGLVTSFQSDCLLLWDGAGAGDSFAGSEGVVASTMARLRPKYPHQLSGEYLTLMIGDLEDSIKLSNRGTTVPHVSPEALKSLPVRIPPLPVQRRIVDLMTHLDNHIAKLRLEKEVALETRSALLTSLIFDRRMAELLPGAEPSPESWRLTTIGELLNGTDGSLRTGPFGTALKAAEYSESGVPVISVGEIGYGAIAVHAKTPRVSPETTARIPQYVLDAGDIVFARKGSIDRSARVKDDEAGYFLGSDGIRLRLPADVDSEFIAYQLSSSLVRDWLKQHAGGSTMPSLSQQVLERLPLVMPPISVQQVLVDVLSDVDKSHTALGQEIDRLICLRSGLLSALLSSLVKIPESYDRILRRTA